MIRKLATVAVALACAAGSSVAASAPAGAAAASVESRSVLPFTGHYRGHDGHHRLVTFFFDGHNINTFKVDGQLIVSSAPVSGAQVHHRCDSHTRKCVRGHWSWDTIFMGVWNDPNQGHESGFEALLYAH